MQSTSQLLYLQATKLVGDCYLDEYMNGETIRDDILEDKDIVLV